MKRALLALSLASLLIAACGVGNTITSAVTGQPTEYLFEDGVRCYYSQSGSLSCVVIR